jgi:hypothetical protein
MPATAEGYAASASPSKIWTDEEIADLPAARLQRRLPHTPPKHVILFGAGASFGSDGHHLYALGRLPPLGKDLFKQLVADPRLKTWAQLPARFVSLFESMTFEEAMDRLDSSGDEWEMKGWNRDLDLWRYFSRFSPLSSNLYWRLGQLVARSLRSRYWPGAFVTLNYDRLLEESLMRNRVFTVVRGVSFFDDNLPPLDDSQLVEACYPHGACQFFAGQNWLKGFENGGVSFGPGAGLEGTAAITHVLKKDNIPIACDRFQMPMICRYQSSKRPIVRNSFLELQQQRAKDLIQGAESVTIVGIYCSYRTDHHLWGALSRATGKIHYIEPDPGSQNLFRDWAELCRKKEGVDYFLISKQFKDGFEYLRKVNSL